MINKREQTPKLNYRRTPSKQSAMHVCDERNTPRELPYTRKAKIETERDDMRMFQSTDSIQ